MNPAVNLGRDATALRLAYAKGPLSVAYVRENVAVAKATDPRRADQNLGVTYDFGVAKAFFLWGKDGSADDRTSVGVIAPVGPALRLMAQYRTEGQTVNAAGTKAVLGSAYALGAEYALSKRTGLFAHYGDRDGAVQSAYRVGLRHKF